MRRMVTAVLTLTLLAGVLVTLPAQRNGAALDATTQSALLAALDEERMAQATYQAVIAAYGAVSPFSNIVVAEQTHVSAVTQLLVRYGVPVPQNPWAVPGAVTVPATLDEAYDLGIAIETEDIALYDALLPTIAKRDIRNVFTNLRAASVNHLAAFQAAASQ